MQFTDSQLQAIQTLDQNLVVMAGAGSGKTSVLVQRYLYLLQSHPDWKISNIVAITFTEKAAKEMRARVRDAIDKLAETPGTDQGTWRERQSQLDSARISTIHSLCAMLLRANAAEAGIDPAFTVLEEADAALLAEEAIEAAMRDLLKGDTAALYETWTPTEIRGILREHLETEIDGTPTADQLYAAWKQHYQTHQAEVIAALRANDTFRQLLAWQPASVPPEDDKLGMYYHAIQRLKEDLLHGTPEAMRAALDELSRIDLRGGEAKNWGGKEGKAEASGNLKALRDNFAAPALKSWGVFGEADREAALYTMLWNAAIRHTQQVYREMKQDRAVVDFGDLERLARELLTGYPDVRARYRGQEFKHLLVDEFQDTNAAQREIVYALSGANSPGSLFVVGDPKQSIYGFRGAQLDVFYQVREEIITAGGAEVILSQSFRTHIPLIDLFNTLFRKLLNDYYEDMQAKREWDAPEIIEVIALHQEDRNGKKYSSDDLRVWQADELALHLKRMVESETLVYDKGRRVTRTADYGDCAVLFQVIAHMNYVEDAFKRAGVPYVTHAGRGYYNRPEVRDLLNLLRALHNRADNLALASTLRSPLFGMSDDTLYRLRQQNAANPMLWDAIFAAEFEDSVLNFVRGALPALAEMAQRVPLPELIGAILSTTAYTAVLRGQPDGARMVNNIEKLIELARRNTQLSLGEFLLYLRDLTDRETREGEAAIETSGAVQLMTVHAAKGLEFPVVALYDCSYEYERSARLIHTPEYGILCKVGEDAPFIYTRAVERITQAERAEKLRKFYVAATRAQDYLIILGGVNTRNWDRSWMGQFYGAFGLPTDPAEIETHIGNGIRLYCPPAPSDRQTPPQTADGWLLIGSQAFEPIVPPLLAPLPPPTVSAPQTLSATDLALLGEAFTRQEAGGLREFRNYILNNQTTILRGHSADRASSPPARRTIGEIVHNALQWLHTGVDVTQQIRASAWSLGVTNDAIFVPALDEVSALIRDIQKSPLWQEIANAEEIYREYPFSFKLGGRVINGKIDVLFRVGKRWHIVDFKSDSVRPEYIRRHAERYHMQLGVYAAAVTEALGKAPVTRLHYLRPNVTITVEGHEWRGAVSSIADRLALAMASAD
jgi:ATP-dependent helicase/nuclease subunit A